MSTGEHLDNHHDSDHPSAKQYVLVGIILTVITILEVGVYYVEALRSLFAAIFLGAGAIKFAFVSCVLPERISSPIIITPAVKFFILSL